MTVSSPTDCRSSTTASIASHLVSRGFRVRLVTATGAGGDLGWHEAGTPADVGPLLEQLAIVVQRRDVAEIDPGDRERAAPVQSAQCRGHEVSDGGEQHGRVEWLGRHVVRVARARGAQLQCQLPRPDPPGQDMHGSALVQRHLGGQMGGRAEAVDAQPAAGRQVCPA